MKQRKFDNLRRLYIPIQFFNELGLSQNQEMEITMEYGEVCIKKFQREDIQNKQFIGHIRKLDELHRIVIPIEYVQLLQLKPGNKITLNMEKGAISLKKI